MALHDLGKVQGFRIRYNTGSQQFEAVASEGDVAATAGTQKAIEVKARNLAKKRAGFPIRAYQKYGHTLVGCTVTGLTLEPYGGARLWITYDEGDRQQVGHRVREKCSPTSLFLETAENKEIKRQVDELTLMIAELGGKRQDLVGQMLGRLDLSLKLDALGT